MTSLIKAVIANKHAIIQITIIIIKIIIINILIIRKITSINLIIKVTKIKKDMDQQNKIE